MSRSQVSQLSLVGWSLACVLGFLACKNGGTNNNPPPPPSGAGGIVVITGTAGAGTGGASGAVNVMIQMPTDQQIALTGSLVDVNVTATVDQGSDFIDPTSVEAVLTATGDTSVLDSTKLASGSGSGFSGRISIGDHPSGAYTLTVSATSSGGVKGKAMVDFQIDAGPTLAVRSPLSLHSYKGLLVVDVFADAGMFGPLDGPHATVANYSVQLDQVLDPNGNPIPNTYRGMINLDDPMPPNVVPRLIDEQLLSVWATDGQGKRVDIHLVFVIDEQGPQITQTSPAPGEIVGDIMTISATVKDPAGVLDSSVIAVIGDDTDPMNQFTVTLKPDGIGVYSLLFDTRKLTGCPDPPSLSDRCIVYPTISFRASDELGNESAVGYDFTVDNIAPVADLDPPTLRSFELIDTVRCSYEFDPLSNNSGPGDMPSDRSIVPQVFDLRARIEDDGNHAPGLRPTPISLVDPDKTAVYILDDENQPLIVDTDGDGWCDAINPTLVPTTEPPTANNQVLKIRLAPVTPKGLANFLPDPTLPDAFCDRGTAGILPPYLCGAFEPTIAIGYTPHAGEPAIWSLEDVDAGWCFGKQFDSYANHIDQGWACIAVQTSDLANNRGVSPPLRVYINYDFEGAPGCTTCPGQACCSLLTIAPPPAPPACTGTYDPTTKAVTKGPCKTRRFDRQPDNSDKYCYGLECPGPFLPR